MMRLAGGNCKMTLKATDFQGSERDKKYHAKIFLLQNDVYFYTLNWNQYPLLSCSQIDGRYKNMKAY